MTDRHQHQSDVALVQIGCIECGRHADEAGRGWRAYVVEDLDDATAPSEVAVYCPVCSLREFGR